MKLRHLFPLLLAVPMAAQQPRGVAEALANLTSTPATHTAFTLDRDMLSAAQGFFPPESTSVLNSVTIENYRFRAPAFYIPENMAQLTAAYNAAHWKHLINQNPDLGQSAAPQTAITDLWLHFHGTEIDDVTVLIRSPRQMSLIEVSGVLRPLDFVHLSGHFGIPRVDPNAVMVPAPPGK